VGLFDHARAEVAAEKRKGDQDEPVFGAEDRDAAAGLEEEEETAAGVEAQGDEDGADEP